MIFFWIKKLVLMIVWLFKPVTAGQVAVIKANTRCRVCGHIGHEHRCVHVMANVQRNLVVKLQARCNNCGARTYEDPIAKVDVTQVSPAIPRTELERAEDETSYRAMVGTVQ